MTRRTRIWLLVLGMPLALIIVLALVWRWDWFIPLVEARASAAIGRPVKIAHLSVGIQEGVRFIGSRHICASYDLSRFIDPMCAARRSPESPQVAHPITFEKKGVRFARIGRRIADDLSGIVEAGGAAFCPSQCPKIREPTTAIEKRMTFGWKVFTGSRDERIPSHDFREIIDRRGNPLRTRICGEIDEFAMTVNIGVSADVADDLAGSIDIQRAASRPATTAEFDDLGSVIPPGSIR